MPNKWLFIINGAWKTSENKYVNKPVDVGYVKNLMNDGGIQLMEIIGK